MAEQEFKFPDEQEVEVKDSEEKFEVEIEDDTPEEDRGRKPMAAPVEEVTDEELDSYDEKVQKRIKRFTKGYHDERRAKEEALREREAAESFAKQVYEENKRLQQQLANGSKLMVEQSKSSAQVELDAAKAKYKKAFEAADPDALAEAQEEIAKATVRLDRAFTMRPIEVEEKPMPQMQQQQQPKISPRTMRWVESNSDWWQKDEEMTSLAIGLDKKLAREYGPNYVGTEEYFQTIDKTMRKRFPDYFQSEEDVEVPLKKRTSDPDEDESPRRAKQTTVVAPATRSTSPNRIRLKASEAATARRLGVPLELYAKQVALLRDRG
jgi:predicted phage tail protein